MPVVFKIIETLPVVIFDYPGVCQADAYCPVGKQSIFYPACIRRFLSLHRAGHYTRRRLPFFIWREVNV